MWPVVPRNLSRVDSTVPSKKICRLKKLRQRWTLCRATKLCSQKSSIKILMRGERGWGFGWLLWSSAESDDLILTFRLAPSAFLLLGRVTIPRLYNVYPTLSIRWTTRYFFVRQQSGQHPAKLFAQFLLQTLLFVSLDKCNRDYSHTHTHILHTYIQAITWSPFENIL